MLVFPFSFQGSLQQMDVTKFALDRNTYLSAASASSLYDSAAKSAAVASSSSASAYGAYHPSVLSKAYFDSKMYQDRNYAFDISKIYHQHHQHSHLQQQTTNLVSGITALSSLSRGADGGSIEDREASHTPQLSDGSNDIKPQMMGAGGADGLNESISGSSLNGSYGTAAAYQYQSSGANDSEGEYRRPLTVIF